MPLDTSIWAFLGSAGTEGAATWLQRFRPPMTDYARSRGWSAPEAEDLARRAIETVCEPAFIAAAYRSKGRLRPLLYAVLREELGPSTDWISIREPEVDALPLVIDENPRPDEAFDRLWALHLLQGAADQLSRESPALAETVALWHGERRPSGSPDRATRHALREGRRRLRLVFEYAIAEYVGSVQEFDIEVSELCGSLRGPGYAALARELLLEMRGKAETTSGTRPSTRLALAAAAICLALLIIPFARSAWKSWTALRSEVRQLRDERESLLQRRPPETKPPAEPGPKVVPPQPVPPNPPPPDAGAIRFQAAGDVDPAALDETVALIRARFERVRRPPPSWDPATRRLTLRSADSAEAEWLITRRALLRARPLAPRELNDRWTPPEMPDGYDWAPLNLFYPAPAAGRQRLLKRSDLLISREDLKIEYDAGKGRVTWTCVRPEYFPQGTPLALLLDEEIFWYGQADESRSGFLKVAPADAQALIPVLFAHGPMPVQFAREP